MHREKKGVFFFLLLIYTHTHPLESHGLGCPSPSFPLPASQTSDAVVPSYRTVRNPSLRRSHGNRLLRVSQWNLSLGLCGSSGCTRAKRRSPCFLYLLFFFFFLHWNDQSPPPPSPGAPSRLLACIRGLLLDASHVSQSKILTLALFPRAPGARGRSSL